MVTLQKLIYGNLFISICLLIALAVAPKQVSKQFSRKSRAIPVIGSLMLVIIFYFRSVYTEYKQNYDTLPEEIQKDTIEFC